MIAQLPNPFAFVALCEDSEGNPTTATVDASFCRTPEQLALLEAAYGAMRAFLVTLKPESEAVAEAARLRALLASAAPVIAFAAQKAEGPTQVLIRDIGAAVNKELAQ